MTIKQVCFPPFGIGTPAPTRGGPSTVTTANFDIPEPGGSVAASFASTTGFAAGDVLRIYVPGGSPDTDGNFLLTQITDGSHVVILNLTLPDYHYLMAAPATVTLAAPSTWVPNGPSGTRYLNPATRDYEIDAVTGQQKQMPSKRQRVLLALMTIQGSVSVDTGRGIKLPRKMTPTFVVEMQQSVRSALYQMTTVERSITVDSIDVIAGRGGRSQVTVSFTDLDTGEQDKVDIG